MRPPSIRRFARDRAGASAVEFALVAIPFLVLLFATFEYGRLVWTRHVLQQTAIVGARCMSLPQSGCSSGGVYDAERTLSFVTANAQDLGVALAAANVSVNRAAICRGLSGFSAVTVSYTFQTAVPQFLEALSSADLQASACFPNQA